MGQSCPHLKGGSFSIPEVFLETPTCAQMVRPRATKLGTVTHMLQ